MKKRKIGIIGFGNMGQAIAAGIKLKYKVLVFDKDTKKTKDSSGMGIVSSSDDLVENCDVVILAIKPQDMGVVLDEIKDKTKDKLIISIAAGKDTNYIEKVLGNVRVVRAMPNIGAKIQDAESVLYKGKYAQDNDLNFAKGLFDEIGKTWVIEKEEMINAATAICGSGPAYIYYEMEQKSLNPSDVTVEIQQDYVRRLTQASEKVGFDPVTSLSLATSVTATSLNLASVPGNSPVELRKQVTSKKGTTEAAIEKLEEGGSWADAAMAAKKRAEELSKE